MNKYKIRESNFELLRIIAMVFIIVHHICVHAFYFQIQNPISDITFNCPVFFKKLFLIDLGFSLGKIGNGLFLLIAGYFLCSNNNNKIVKTAKKILLQVLFVAILLTLTSTVYYLITNDIRIQMVDGVISTWWFIGYYLSVVILGYLFINKFINNLTKDKYTMILVILFISISTSFIRELINGISPAVVTMVTGLFLYLSGGYINKYNPFKKIKIWHILLFVLSIIAFMFFSYYNFTLNNINTALLNNTNTYMQQFRYYEEYTTQCLLMSIALFELFKRFKINKNKVINYISSSTFIIYLIHDNLFGRALLRLINWQYYLHEHILLFILIILLVVITIFILGVIIYTIYEQILKQIDKYCKKYIS